MGYDERMLPVYKVGDHVHFTLAGLWHTGNIVMFDPDNSKVCVELPLPLLPWPLGQFCYVGRSQVRRGPVMVWELTDLMRHDDAEIFAGEEYTLGAYSGQQVCPDIVSAMSCNICAALTVVGPAVTARRLGRLHLQAYYLGL